MTPAKKVKVRGSKENLENNTNRLKVLKIIIFREDLLETTNQLASNVGEEDSNPQAVIMFITAAGLLVNMNSAAMKLSRRIVFSMSCCLSQRFFFSSLLLNFAWFWFKTSSFPSHLIDFSLIFKW